jgi:hypothetical protein
MDSGSFGKSIEAVQKKKNGQNRNTKFIKRNHHTKTKKNAQANVESVQSHVKKKAKIASIESTIKLDPKTPTLKVKKKKRKSKNKRSSVDRVKNAKIDPSERSEARKLQTSAWLNHEEEDDQDFLGEDVEELEGVIHEGILLLRDKKSDRLYSSERNEAGDLVEVGIWKPDGKHDFTSYTWKLIGLKKNNSDAPEQLNFKVTDPTDHCETSIRAYLDIKRALEEISYLLPGIDKPAMLKVWDPFFCTGRMKSNMISIGFPNVHNENEDFYTIMQSQHYPKHDILLTNPPYSQDHIPRLLQYCNESIRAPCFLLLPSYVVNKEYFSRFDAKDSKHFFIIPKSGRYTYHNPGLDGAKVGRTAPFQSFWYVNAKEYRGDLLRQLTSIQSSEDTTWEVCKSIAKIPSRFWDLEY